MPAACARPRRVLAEVVRGTASRRSERRRRRAHGDVPGVLGRRGRAAGRQRPAAHRPRPRPAAGDHVPAAGPGRGCSPASSAWVAGPVPTMSAVVTLGRGHRRRTRAASRCAEPCQPPRPPSRRLAGTGAGPAPGPRRRGHDRPRRGRDAPHRSRPATAGRRRPDRRGEPGHRRGGLVAPPRRDRRRDAPRRPGAGRRSTAVDRRPTSPGAVEGTVDGIDGRRPARRRRRSGPRRRFRTSASAAVLPPALPTIGPLGSTPAPASTSAAARST